MHTLKMISSSDVARRQNSLSEDDLNGCERLVRDILRFVRQKFLLRGIPDVHAQVL